MTFKRFQATTIDWKSDAKNLVKLYPRKMDVDDEEGVQDRGSFFNFFVDKGDDFGVRIGSPNGGWRF